ncbi:hypothetical protein DL770_005221 [Monosporascus sp. CRB-9-2]|nr:hypothetical protein DL770_005221 [Monosporascus sp. CRB-9-2]
MAFQTDPNTAEGEGSLMLGHNAGLPPYTSPLYGTSDANMAFQPANGNTAADVAIGLLPKNSAWANSHIGGSNFNVPYQTQRTDRQQSFMDPGDAQQTFGHLENTPFVSDSSSTTMQYPIVSHRVLRALAAKPA